MAESTTSIPKDFFYNLPAKRQHIIALAILFVIPLILFFGTTLGGKDLQRHDITQWRAGAESAIEYRETYNDDALWLNNMFLGMPTYVVSLKTVVPHLDFITKYFKTIYPAFQYWVMLFGMYFLLILMGFRPLTAVFGSLTFGLTSYFPIIIIAGHTSKFVALAFAPWIFSGYWLLTRSPKKIVGLLLFCVAMTLEVRAGHPQITYYFMYLLAGLWIFDSWTYLKIEKDYKKWGFITTLLLVGGIFGILGHAQNLLTLSEYSPFSIRGGSALENTTGLSTGYAFLWSQGIKETFTLFVPDLFGGASPTYFGSKPGTAGPHYLGALTLPFLLLALFKQRSKLMYMFFGVGTLAIFFAWGENFLLLNSIAFDYIPFFNKFRAPETWLVLTVFCYTIVAVYGLQWFFDFIKVKSVSIKELMLPMGLTLAFFLFIVVQVKTMEYTRPGEIDSIANQIAQQNQVNPNNPQVLQQATNYVKANLIPDREKAANGDVFRFGLFLVIGGVVIYLFYSKKFSIGTGSLVLVLLVGVDLINVDKRFIPERAMVSSEVNPESYLESQKRDIDQFIIDQNAANGVYPNRTFPLLDDPFQNATPSYFYPTIGGYTGAKLSIVSDLQKGGGPLYQGSAGLNLNLLGALNIKFITYQPGLNIPDMPMVFTGSTAAVYENKKILPKAFFVDTLAVAQSPQEAFDFISQANVDYSSIAVVEGATSTLSTNADSSSTVEVTFYSGQDITLKTSRSKKGFLVLSEVYYPAGWIATIDEKEVPIYKTNYLLRGIQVPEGEHEIKLSFEPKSYTLGVTLSWLSLGLQVLLGLFVGFSYLKTRKIGH